MIAVIRALLTGLAGGSALAALGSVVAAVSALILGLVYRRYVGILGADRRRPAERQAYDALRANLTGGGLAARLYTQWLTTFLNRVDRFFGDAGMADRTLFPRAFGLRTPAPLWTAPPFDRCLLLALIYVLGTIFVLWAVSGRVGPAEAALDLRSDFPSWRRCFSALALMLAAIGYWKTIKAQGWSSLAWFAVAVTGSIAVAVAGAGAGAVAGTVSIAGLLALARVGFGVPSGTVAVAVAFAFAFSGAGGVIGVGVVAVPIAFLHDKAVKHSFQGGFLAIFLLIMILVCLISADLLSPLKTWSKTGSLLLFLGLLPLINAPFDWCCVGLTRALLRRGLELGGWWPLLLALTDAVFATMLVVMLALVMVVGVQLFYGLASHGGGSPILPLNQLFDGIATDAASPEYWWVYGLLLSTMVPSFVNLAIGATSLLRGVPGVPPLLLQFMPARGRVLRWDRAWIAAFLTVQGATGAVLGIAAQALLAVVIIGYIMPFFGLELLGIARDVAAFNLPMRTWQLFGHLR